MMQLRARAARTVAKLPLIGQRAAKLFAQVAPCSNRKFVSAQFAGRAHRCYRDTICRARAGAVGEIAELAARVRIDIELRGQTRN